SGKILRAEDAGISCDLSLSIIGVRAPFSPRENPGPAPECTKFTDTHILDGTFDTGIRRPPAPGAAGPAGWRRPPAPRAVVAAWRGIRAIDPGIADSRSCAPAPGISFSSVVPKGARGGDDPAGGIRP